MLVLDIFICCLVAGWLWALRRHISLYRKVGARFTAVPILGQIYKCMTSDREKILKVLFDIGDHAIANGGLSAFTMFTRFFLMIADAEDAVFVLKHHLEKDDFVVVLRYFTRDSSIFAPVSIWRPRRKVVSALLSSKNVNKFEPAFVENSETLVQQWRPLAGQEAFPLWERFNAFMVDVTCETMLGIDLKSQKNLKEPLRTSLNSLVELGGQFVLKIWLHVEFIAKRTSFYQSFLEHNAVVKSYIEKAVNKLAPEMHTGKEDESHDGKKVNLLQMFMELKDKRGFDHTMLNDETLGLLIAASDTTAMSASMVSVALSRHPHVQDKVYSELRQVFGNSDRPVTAQDLPSLSYLEAVIKETQRLYPPVPHITRKTLEDSVLPSGVKVPKGTNLAISIYALNRNPKYWGDDADQFRPERFLDGSVPERTIHFAFSHGPRNCPGMQFAFMTLKTVLATLLRRYRLLPASDAPLRFQFGVSMKAVDQFLVRMEAR